MTAPYYQDEHVTLYHGDALEVLPTLTPQTAACVIADPPYNIGKAAWDWIDRYEDWCADWVAQTSATLAPGGAFWCYHSEPLVLATIARQIEAHGRPLVSWITLDKSSWGIAKRYANAGSKTFPASVEYATYSRREVYAEQITALRESLGMTRAEFDTEVSPSRRPTGITYRWEHGERVPQPTEVAAIEERFGVTLTVPTFNNGEKHSAVWQFPQTDTTDHPTPKPLSTVARQIEVTSNPGDLILDPFAGSGTTLRAAKDLGRRAIGVELAERYCEVIARRLSQGVLDLWDLTKEETS